MAIHADLRAVFGNPTRGGIGLMDRHRVVRLRRGRVIDVDRRCAGGIDQVADQAFVGREVAQHPAAAMEEHESRQHLASAMRRPHDHQVQRLAVGLDGLAAYIGRRQGCIGLGVGQHLTRLRGAQLLDRRAATAVERLEEVCDRAQWRRLVAGCGRDSSANRCRQQRGGDKGEGSLHDAVPGQAGQGAGDRSDFARQGDTIGRKSSMKLYLESNWSTV